LQNTEERQAPIGGVLPHPGMLPNGLGIASPECSRRGVTLSIGIQRVLLEIWHMLAAA
jgi:hypothetical protein